MGKIKTLYSDIQKQEQLFPRTKVEAISDENGNGLEAILQDLDQRISQGGGGGGGTNIQLDTTLTQAGKAADAKAVGDRIDSLDTIIAVDEDSDGNIVLRPYNGEEEGLVQHITDVNNPHEVTAEQVGARPNTWLPTIEEIGAAPSGYGLGTIAVDCNDCNALLPTGFYQLGVNTLNKPAGNEFIYAVMLNIWRKDHMIVQICYGVSGSNNIAIRQIYGWSSGEWGEWERIDASAFAPAGYGLGSRLTTVLSNADQLDAFVLGGFARYYDSSYVQVIPGMPDGYDFVVCNIGSDPYLVQLAIARTGQTIFMRHFRAGTWGEWVNVSPTAFAPANYGLSGPVKNVTSFDEVDSAGWYSKLFNAEEMPAGACHGNLTFRTSIYGGPKYFEIIMPVSYTFNDYSVLSMLRKRRDDSQWYDWEWENPPMIPGVEYRTTERYDGKPVYTALVNCGNLPLSGMSETVWHFSNWTTTAHIFECDVTYGDVNGGTQGTLNGLGYEWRTANFNMIRILNPGGADYSGFIATALIKYWKG